MARRMRSRSTAYACCNDWAGSRDEHFSVGADEVVKFECRAQFGSIPFVGLVVLLVRSQKWVLRRRVG